MTKIEFESYVNSFKGKFTEDELYQVCETSRNELITPCTWNELADLLNVNKSGNALKSWYYRYSKKAGDSLSIDDSVLKDKDVSKYVEEYKETTKNRDVLNAIRKHIRDEARVEVIKDSIKETISKLTNLPEMLPAYQHDADAENNEAIMLLSDMHIGVKCNNFCNKYNSLIAEERLNKFVNDTITYCKQMHVVRLNVLNLGDMIHGLIHTTARIEEEFDVVTQVMVASELLAKALNKLQQAAPEVIYRSVTDNHSRTVANIHENIENENFYRIIDWYLEERLKNTDIVFDHESNLDPSFVFFTLLNGQTACAAHGHLDNINTSVQNFSGLTHTFVDNIFLAHYHDEKVKNFQGATVFVNGSIVGPEQYAISKRLVGYPTQKLIIYCESSRLDISIKLN